MNISFKAAALLLPLSLVLLPCCSRTDDRAAVPGADEEPEAIARTEFTDRLENFFEYEPLRPGEPSQFRIHLTDLADGSPVDQAQVSLTVRRKGAGETIAQTTAKVGKVMGIYVAELSIPQAGEYDIEFHIKNAKLDERLPLSDFKVE
jgi:hypothetical protein